MLDPENSKSNPQVSERSISRRQFAVRAALASAAAAYLPSAALPLENSASPLTLQTPASETKLSAEAQAEVDARVQTILARYGSHLSDAQKAEVRRLTTQLQPALESLRKAPLANGDAPALYLKPLVEREKKP